jgi:serine/threonine-protein kinase
MVPLEGERTPVPLLTSIFDEKQPRVSPDMKWLAYVSNESGRYEVYVRSLAPNGGRVPVSAEGGGEPLWGPDSHHLYYRVADKVIEATITTAPSLGVATRKTLFGGPFATDIFHPDYDIAPDGKSFVMVKPAQDRRRLVLVTNWARELQRRIGNAK